ncbi:MULTISPECIES: TonB-dependent siderophore receptor [Methylobacterium]|uniref:Ferrichrome outer membrane transporter/phage receptor n=4 Tax=Pseudomonadota TaxID=1224 RepID=A0ABQ4T0Y4_9HYPH|nr:MULTISPECIES: TonB-dependent siderophore receptor [Methylobacterium]PIU08496.1 MAG: TonB-dependent siderophore receptor [Methylobacterium sp. CG09_land_8_20_14_0_10_71_15]PIU15157.1 MAG: TonB-dependent siderophore receptor [Methylobacterium sp. CG08_land_8_20_14_0_20_71_15]GBU19201.1 ferrichrome outer membrane transporter [Methylobacterium sp.]GJE08131.1 Ferrichrome outer membrane transporter/phage receptor [Methylobacterium jeotgali]
MPDLDPRPALSAAARRRWLSSTILSGIVLAWSGAPALGQGAGEVTLDTLAVEGAAGPANAVAGTGLGGPQGPVPGYVASRSSVGTKTDTPILETAQSISVVGRKQIEDQNALTINQALRYTPSVTTEQRGSSGATRLEQFYIRGFSAPIYLDGMLLPGGRDAFPTIDPFRLERIDIIKGPSSILYGQAGPGGIVNLVSKVPRFVQHGEIFVQGGSFSTVRGGVDVGGPIPSSGGPGADQFAYRIIAGGWDADGPVRTTRIERAFINPSLTWRPSLDTSLTIIANYQRDPYSGYYGALPGKGTLFPSNFGIANGPLGRLPRDFYDGDPNIERSDRTQASAQYIFDHRFDEGLRVHSTGRFLRTLGDYRSLYDSSANNFNWAGRFLNRQVGGTNVAVDAFTTDNNLVAKFGTGIFDHTVLVGLDHRTLYTKTLSGPFENSQNLDLLNPVYGRNIAFPAFTALSDITAQQTGIYFQDQIKFDRLVLTLGGRYDWARQSGPTRTLATGAVSTQDAPAEAFTGRASLLYLFDSGVAPYVSYSEAFEPIVSGLIYDGRPDTGRLPDPITSRQFEAGVKYQPPGTDILLTAAAFDIKRQNALSPDPINGTRFSVQTGEVSVQGVEFEARANLSESLTLVGGVSLIDAVNSAGTNTTVNETTRQTVLLRGLRPAQVPDTTVSLFADYRFLTGPLAGLGIGGGVRYLGGSQGDAANSFQVPANYVLDAVASYDFGYLDATLKGMQLQLNVQNLLDERYVQSCVFQAWCYYGLPRTVYATMRYRW